MRRQRPPLRAYLSYPMTLATAEDKKTVDEIRRLLRCWPGVVTFYDPDQDEDKSKPLWQIQNDDYQQLLCADLLLATITPGTAHSKGECAEIEWAVRALQRPVLVWNPDALFLPPWIDATLQNGRTEYYFDEKSLYNALVTLRNTQYT